MKIDKDGLVMASMTLQVMLGTYINQTYQGAWFPM